MKIILTGGAGFIGSCYLWKLNSLGIDQVYVVDTHDQPDEYKTLQKKKFSDYLERNDLLKRLENGQFTDVDAIVHLGACADTTEMDKAYLKKNNIEYSQFLTKWALSKNKHFHYASSAAIYGDGKKGYNDDDQVTAQYTPLNPYGESKWLFDRWLIDEKLTDRVVGFRYFNVFGPNEYHKADMRSMVNKAYDQFQESKQVKLFATSRNGYGDESEERDFVYVKDINNVMAYFLENPNRHGIFNLGTGKARTFKDLVTSVFVALKKPVNIKFIPMPDKLKGQYQYFTQADLKKLRAAGYNKEFTSLEESVADYVKNHLTRKDPYL